MTEKDKVTYSKKDLLQQKLGYKQKEKKLFSFGFIVSMILVLFTPISFATIILIILVVICGYVGFRRQEEIMQIREDIINALN